MAARRTLGIAVAVAGVLIAAPAAAAPPAPGEILDAGARNTFPQPATYCEIEVGAVTTIPKGGQYTLKWMLGTQGLTLSDPSPIRGTEVYNTVLAGITATGRWDGVTVELYKGKKLVDTYVDTSSYVQCPFVS